MRYLTFLFSFLTALTSYGQQEKIKAAGFKKESIYRIQDSSKKRFIGESYYDSSGRIIRDRTYRMSWTSNTSYKYDSQGKLVTKLTTHDWGDDEPNITTYKYDNKGRLIRSKFQKLHPVITEYEYDKTSGKLLQCTTHYPYISKEDKAHTIKEVYSYDKKKRLKQILTYEYKKEQPKKWNEKAIHKYDEKDRLIKSTQFDKSGKEISHTIKEYDEQGRLSKETEFDSSGKEQSHSIYTYNEFGLLTADTTITPSRSTTYIYEYVKEVPDPYSTSPPVMPLNYLRN